MNIELEHGLHDTFTNVSDDDPTSPQRARSRI
jgi:hypothetical protein